ncbi:hypothetical protein CGCVW01_v012188 [Colletotrichum viniferum]|nr:hypothetical protein CGCVW01_v012188 [Colletotrichum viniferum]
MTLQELQDILAPNLQRYKAQLDGEYVSTRVVTHNGTTIAVALAKAKNGVLSFNYSILDTAAGSQMDKGQASSTAAVDEKCDSKCWFDNVKTLNFPSEVRVIGEEAVPVYQIPAVDPSNRKTVRSPAHGQKLDEWLSSSLCLIDQDVSDFQLLSDGHYVYLFRQSAPMENGFPNQFMTAGDAGTPPVDRNLLCDRFILVGSTLNQPLEARYQRSRQKQIPLNDQDTLSVKDINDEPFYEPTFSLRFVQDLELGRFCVLRAPTMINNVTKWMIFAYSHKTGEVECLTTDVSSNGLFDLHGHVYYTCKVKEHDKVFANGPGPCTATRKDDGRICGKARVPILPETPASKRSVELSDRNGLTLQNHDHPEITSLLEGFTLEVWVQPEDSINDTGSLADESVKGGFSLFRFSENSPGVFINDKYHVEIRKPGEDDALVVSGAGLEAKVWSHVAITYDPSTQSYAIVINGVISGSVTSKLRPGALLGLGPQPNGSSSCFKGLFDEMRLWRRPLHPSTIKSKMRSRATGLELDLKSCWHFDEGSGMTVFDATSSHHLTITSTEGGKTSPDVWKTFSAPMVGSHGIARKVLRVPSSVKTTGGLCATVYNEQVAVSEEKADMNDGSGSTPDAGGNDKPKNMKRGARVLLGFVVSDKSPRLAILDLCLLSDGTLCDTPALIPLPTLSMPAPTSGDTSPHHGSLDMSTALLYVGGEGLEIFGGILSLDTIECEPSAPCAFESGTGSVTIFFKGKSLDRSSFSALKYNISRKVIATELSASILGGHKGLLSTSKLQKAVNVVFETTPCPWAMNGLAVNLTLTANMPDDNKIIETWTALPSQIDKFCSLINGSSPKPDKVGTLIELKNIPNNGDTGSKIPSVEISLRAGAEVSVAAGTFLNIGSRGYFVLQDAKVGDMVLVATLFNDKRPEGKPPKKGSLVLSSTYDHEDLVKYDGKSAGDSTKGSKIVSMAWSPSAVASGQAATSSSAKLQTSSISYIKGSGQSPSFGSPPRSTSLRLDGRTTYSMLEDTVATAACAGICFETWIKAEINAESTIVVAYKSERLPRADGFSKEEQKFVLGVTQPSEGNNTYHIVGNINDSHFIITNPSVLKPGHWSHLACSSRSTFAVRFSGNGYIDLGKTEQWNVSDFSLAFSLQLSEKVDHDQPILVKGDSNSAPTPLKIDITKDGNICLYHWAADDGGSNVRQRTFQSRAALLTGQAYKIFISRKAVQAKVSGDDNVPKPCQVVTMRAWRLNGECDIEFPPEIEDKFEQMLELMGENSPRQFHGAVQGNEASLCLGGAQWTETRGLQGIIGSVQLYSSAIHTPASPLELCGKAAHKDSLIGSWSCREPGGFSLIDDLGRNNGKLRGDLEWVVGPYKSDYELSIFLNAIPVDHGQPDVSGKTLLDQATPAGPHQLSLGNILVSNEDDDDSRFLGLEQGFCGELDELRIWNVPRTRQEVCDSMNTSLTEISGDLAVYLPFHDEKAVLDALERSYQNLTSVLTDASVNCWHLTPLSGAVTTTRASEAPIGHDSPCVNHALGAKVHQPHGADIRAGPSVAEYGEMEISSSGNMEGSYKRAYSYIDEGGDWCLVTGFRIGALKTEWVSQVQTSPTLIGFIEGAPPLPIESFTDRDRPPTTSVKFENNTRCTYTYSARSESTIGAELSWSKGAGIKWDVEAGVAVQTEISEGKTRGSVRRGVDASCGKVNNEVNTSTTNSNLEMAVQLTSIWKESTGDDSNTKSEGFAPSNAGLALVESEVADVFALRLQMRGSIAPVVAYQLRPNPDIPKDRNLISFNINPKYTKQGCLDGRHGLNNDPDYPAMASARKMRRIISQLRPTHFVSVLDVRRSNSRENMIGYRLLLRIPLGTFRGGRIETSATRTSGRPTESEIGGNLDYRNSVGASVETEVSIGSLLTTGTVDAMASAHSNFVITKEKASEQGFELVTELPPPVDLRCKDPDTGEYVKRAGAVDAYRWMSFWLEPSVEATDTFFEHVLNRTWLEDSPEPNAQLLRTLREGLKNETGNARTKAWRVLHRCTYVSRIPEKVESRPRAAMSTKEQKPSTLLADIGSNWLLIQKLEPFARDANSRGNLANTLKPHVLRFFPTLIAQTRLYNQVLEMLADYVGLS